MDGQAVSIENLSKHFGNIEALKNLSLSVPQGKIYSLLGPNGAGKTTLIRILTTLLKPDSGTARVGGFDVVKESGRVRSVIGLAGQYAAVDENLTGKENLEMMGRLYHLLASEVKERSANILERMGLQDAANRLVRTYSGGMRRRLDLGASFITQPKVLFLDEPTTGLDPQSRLELWNIIRELVKEGTTILLTTQYLDEAEELADKIIIIDKGEAIAQGTTNELKSIVGGKVLDVTLSSESELEKAQRVFTKLGAKENEIAFDKETKQLKVNIDENLEIVTRVLTVLESSGINILDLHLRRPSLNEAFLKLTGVAVNQ